MAQWVKALDMQAGCPEFNPWNPVKVEGENRPHKSLPSICVLWHAFVLAYVNACVQTCTHNNQLTSAASFSLLYYSGGSWWSKLRSSCL